MFSLTDRYNKLVNLLVSYISHVIGHYVEARSFNISCWGPGEIHDVTEFHISGTFSFLMLIIE